MGFLKKLLGIGVTAGATVAAVRVADKYKEDNPNGTQDLNNDGKVDAADVIIGVTKAASAVYNDATSKVKEKAPEYGEKARAAASTVSQKVEDTVNSVVNGVKQ